MDVWTISALAMAKAASKNYLSVFNTDVSLVVSILYARVNEESAAAVVGLLRGYRLFRITGHSVGTLVTPIAHDTRSQALPAGVTSRSNGQAATVTGIAIGLGSLNEDETGGGFPAELFSWKETSRPIVCRVNQGVVIQQDATAGVGLLSARLVFGLSSGAPVGTDPLRDSP